MAYEFRGNTLENTAGRRPRARAAAPVPRERRERATSDRSPAQILAAVFGLVFLLVGIAGFIPGLTSHVGDLKVAGTDSHAELLGLFRVSILHNIVHLLFGVGLIAAARASWARLYLIGGGVAYLLVVAYGFIVEESSDANFLPVNNADNLLHLGLTLAMLAAGVATLAADRRSAS
jgi:hypothetical protein